MYRFSEWLGGLRPDFWKVFYEHPDLLNLFSYINSVQAAKSGGYDMLSMYDILEIGEHNPGHTVVWQPINIASMVYVAGHPYPYQYAINENWIYIDCLYDKRVDPKITLQHITDFRLINHKLCFIKYPETDSMLVSKGLYAGTRLADDFGRAFGFTRKDSFDYRDKMVPLMELFFSGPNIHNVKAAANVMINNPVAKYGNETVVSTDGGDVLTDAYRYNLGGAHLAYNVGDTVARHTPFADAIELATDKTYPNWWLDRLPQLFQKYKVDGQITKDQRDIMMSTLLRYYVAHIRINLNKTDYRQYAFYPDVWSLLLDGSPVRTDYILSMYYLATDLDMPVPNREVNKVKLTAHAIWGTRDISSDMWICAPKVVKPVFYPDGTKDAEWYYGSPRYHILDEDKRQQEFWSSEKYQCSYVEPHLSNWYGILSKTTAIKNVSKYAVCTNTPIIEHFGAKVQQDRPYTTELMSVITDKADICGTKTRIIYGDQNIAHEDLDEWEMHDTCHLGIEGLVVDLNKKGYGVSPPLDVGGIPKVVTANVVVDVPAGTSINVYFSTDKVNWALVPANANIGRVKDNVYFKAEITASTITSPVFKGIDVSIRV